jgi:hypothetical protein
MAKARPTLGELRVRPWVVETLELADQLAQLGYQVEAVALRLALVAVVVGVVEAETDLPEQPSEGQADLRARLQQAGQTESMAPPGQ